VFAIVYDDILGKKGEIKVMILVGETLDCEKVRAFKNFRDAIAYVVADFGDIPPSNLRIAKEATPSERETISEFLKH